MTISVNKNPKSQYKAIYDKISSLGAAIFFAIEQEDHVGVEYVFHSKSIDTVYQERSGDFLENAYSMDNLKIAALLIKNGAKFNPPNLLRINATPNNNTLYKDHLDSLSNIISNSHFEEATAIIDALISIPPVRENNYTDFNLNQILFYNSVTNDKTANIKLLELYTSITNIDSAIVNATLTAVGLDMLKHKNTVLVTTYVKNAARSAEYKPSDEFGNKKIIYMPFYLYDANEKSIFIHELGHYAEDAIYNNQALPYFENHSADYKPYVINVIKDLVSVTHSSKLASILYEFIEANSDIAEIINYLSKNSYLPLFSYKSHNHEVPYINAMFDLYQTRKEYFLTEVTFKFKEDYIQASYNKVTQSINEHNLKVLDRMAEALFRPEYSVEAELAVRPGELEVSGVDKSSLKLIGQLTEYWKIFTIPVVEKMRAEIFAPVTNETNATISILGDSEEQSDL